MDVCNKLVCLFLAGLSSLVQSVWIRPGPYPIEEHLIGLPGSNTLAYYRHFVNYECKIFHNIGPVQITFYTTIISLPL
jgi:hypothetical protein